DTPVTTFASTALGAGLPVVVAPAMHESMYRHPGVSECIRCLSSWKVTVIPPRREEGKAKIADIDEIVLWCCRALPGSPLAGKHVLITSGPCREPVDDIRVLTTRSTGRMGRELALQAFRLGAEVTVVHAGVIPCVRNIPIETAGEMHDAVHRICAERIPDIYISAAAISDYAPEPYRGKLRSGQTLSIPLHPLPKLIDEVCRRYNTSVIAFKVGEEGEEGAAPLIAKGADLVVINGPESMGSDTTDAIISGAGGREQIRGTKRELAARIWERIRTLPLPQG
ncbi:MAG TPA: phosphopantothenoylcysteine decarboxylase, partial [Methanoregulaceae archaeon]|nr:phosphopantothenoylcysteine decarboxylase [Methanoregulaceae archaeon]